MLFLLLVVRLVDSEINTSSELNCDFSTECKWRNGTDDNGEWALTNKLQIDATRNIMSMSGNEEAQFLYTHGFMGRTVSILVSDVVTCQLGGANLKYWYYKTGQASQLDICIRQPPGSRETASLRCYDGISSTHAQQWIFRIIELPPSSQPFEILFRATFYPPTDVIALDDIVFDAALCVQQEGIPLRSTRAAPPIIGFRDWQLLRESEHFKGQTMIVVSQNFGDQEVENTTSSSTTISTSSSIALTTTRITASTTTSTEIPSTSTLESLDVPPTASKSLYSEDHISNFVRLLKETAPILPYIPTLVRSLTSSDLSGAALGSVLSSPPDVRHSPVKGQHYYNTGSQEITFQQPRLTQIPSSQIDLLSLFTTTPMSTTLSNVFGIPSTTLKPIKIAPTVYPVSLIRNHKTEQLKEYLEKKKEATTLKDIDTIHTELFKKDVSELKVFKKPTKAESDLATQLTELAGALPPDAINDLQTIRNIPDLEGLVKGMDLSLIRKPGGFAKLRQQFIQRFMRRSMGLPLDEPMEGVLPAPIVPVKVTKKAMMQRAFLSAKLRRT